MTSVPETIQPSIVRNGPNGCRLFEQKSLPAGGASVVINLYNDTTKEVRIFWVDSTGTYHDYGSIRPKDEFELLTTNFQVLLLTDTNGFCLGTMMTRPNLQANVSTFITKVGCSNGKLGCDKNKKCKMNGRKSLDQIRGIKRSSGVTPTENGFWRGWRIGVKDVDGFRTWSQWNNRIEGMSMNNIQDNLNPMNITLLIYLLISF